MRDSILTVITPASTHDLTTLETVKDELKITDGSQDARLYRWIAQASGFIRTYCDRVFARETVSELWRSSYGYDSEGLRLRRWPIETIDSISENDAADLLTTDYEFDAERGLLWRLKSARRTSWCTPKLLVTYTAGYALLDDLPYGLEMACIEMIKFRTASRGRDPGLRRQEIPGELVEEFWVPGPSEDGVPAEIRSMLDPFRRVTA